MKLVDRILTPTFTVDIRGLSHEALVKEITEKLSESVAINLQNSVFFLLLLVVAKLLCNHAEKHLCTKAPLLHSASATSFM